MNRFLDLIIKVLSKGVVVAFASTVFALSLAAFFVLWLHSIGFLVSVLENTGMPEDSAIGLSIIVTMGFIGGSIYGIVQESKKGEING